MILKESAARVQAEAIAARRQGRLRWNEPAVCGRGWSVVGKPPAIECDEGRRVHSVAVLSRQVLIAAGNVGELRHSAHRNRRIGIGVKEFLPGCRLQLDVKTLPRQTWLPAT
jgi:hypothetical protein